MSESIELPDFDDIADCFWRLGALQSPSELHGYLLGQLANGNGPASFPSLKSQHPEYLVAQLKKFKDGTRANDPGKMMQNVAARMLDSEMMAVAAYLAGIQ